MPEPPPAPEEPPSDAPPDAPTSALLRARNVERAYGLPPLYLKFEGGNPTGSQKDRLAAVHVRDARTRGFEVVTVATCGNYGAAVAHAAHEAGLRCVIFVPEGYHTRRLEEMAREGAEVRRLPGTYEDVVEASRAYAAEVGAYDANPGGANTAFQVAAYAPMAGEITRALPEPPAAVALPVSNGTLLAGLYSGFARLAEEGQVAQVPALVAGSTAGQNPIVQAWLRHRAHADDLPRERVRESEVNEPLVNWHALDGEDALLALRATGGWAADVSDRVLTRLATLLREQEGLHVLPAATAGLAAFLDRHRREPLTTGPLVAVLTARRF